VWIPGESWTRRILLSEIVGNRGGRGGVETVEGAVGAVVGVYVGG
jgi:hypothetical protein